MCSEYLIVRAVQAKERKDRQQNLTAESLGKNSHKLDFKYIIPCDFYIDFVSGMEIILSYPLMSFFSTSNCWMSGNLDREEKPFA